MREELSNRRRRGCALALSITLVAPLLPLDAALAADAADAARAQQLFDDAKQLMDQGKYADACPKLEESQHVAPADGALLRWAWCEEELGKLATAWVLFKDGLTRAKAANNAVRIKFATDHLAAIEPKLSKVTIAVPPSAASVAGLEVRWDGKALGQTEWNAEFPVDPGDHSLSASAPGRETWTTTVGIGAVADRRTVEVPQLPAAKSASTTADVAAIGDAGGSKRTTAYVLAGAGVVFLGGFIGAQLMASSAHEDRKADCLKEVAPVCDDTGQSKIRTWETISFVSAGLAAASIGAAIYFFASAPSTESPTKAAFIRATPTAMGFQIEGAF